MVWPVARVMLQMSGDIKHDKCGNTLFSVCVQDIKYEENQMCFINIPDSIKKSILTSCKKKGNNLRTTIRHL